MGAWLATPRLRVVLNEDDEEAIEVQTINADMVLAEVTAQKHHWGNLQESAGMRLTTFLAWAALRRKKLIPPDLLWETFETTTASVSAVELTEDDKATPTRPDLVSG